MKPTIKIRPLESMLKYGVRENLKNILAKALVFLEVRI